jgi:hypothetical protein
MLNFLKFRGLGSCAGELSTGILLISVDGWLFDRVVRSNTRLINAPVFVDAQSLQPFITKDLED